jgi:hypothetical protein
MTNNANPHGPTGREAAFLVGVSRRTLYRWLSEGRLAYPITYAGLSGLAPRRRGPQRNPLSRRYHAGRHTWRED